MAKDYVEAYKWELLAAGQGDEVAKKTMTVLDQVETVKLYRKASEQNLAEAQFTLGVCYHKGDGVAKDLVEAAKWFRRAAEQNIARAQYELGFCYTMGEGVAKDYVEAYKWELLASGQGDELAKKTMTILESQMTPEQIAEAQKLARSFKPRKMPSHGER